jgi:NADH-quinone oxidoreductase subunit G
MGKITIDGKEYEFEYGQTVIDVAFENGLDIPHFCWHPKLSVSGNCRMCLVEIEKMPKLAIACATLAADGMVVYTKSEKAIAARNAVMEFLLINHPLDCPICDEAGECKLQEYAFKHSKGESRFVEEKVHKNKRVKLGPFVMFDAERCISCSRCIRFSEEIAKKPQLTFVKRGDRVTIETYPGESFDNPYSLNVVDICPVGALTNIDFRFKARVWDMTFVKSICPGCARGCNIEIGVRKNEILRLHPRYNEKVNDYWMCDYGRIEHYKHVNAESRVKSPRLCRYDEYQDLSWDDAFEFASNQLAKFSKKEIAFIFSPYATLEDNYVFLKFIKQFFGDDSITSFPKHEDAYFGDEILRRSDRTPNMRGLLSLELNKFNYVDIRELFKKIDANEIKAVYSLENNLVEVYPESWGLLKKLKLFILHATNHSKTTQCATILLPAATFAEKNGTFVNFEGIVQRIRPAVETIEPDTSLDGIQLGRWDLFGTEFDRWGKKYKIDARSSWKILREFSKYFGKKFEYQDAEDVFIELTKEYKCFKDMTYESIGENGEKIKTTVKEESLAE